VRNYEVEPITKSVNYIKKNKVAE